MGCQVNKSFDNNADIAECCTIAENLFYCSILSSAVFLRAVASRGNPGSNGAILQ